MVPCPYRLVALLAVNHDIRDVNGTFLFDDPAPGDLAWPRVALYQIDALHQHPIVVAHQAFVEISSDLGGWKVSMLMQILIFKVSSYAENGSIVVWQRPDS